MMEYRQFRNIQLSRLGMGNMRLPQKDGKIDMEAAQKIIDAAMDAGVNYYDTAYIYHGGESEVFVGNALRKYPRDSYYIADKFNFQAQPDYEKQFAQQLERLGTAYIDFYLLHGIQDNFVDDILACGCIEYFDQLKKEGKITYFGFSFHGNPENLKKVLAAYNWDFVQIQLNYYDWEYGNQKELYEILHERNIPVVIMEPVHGGLLAKLNEEAGQILKEADPDASYASWAMRWIKSLDGVYVVLSGMGDTDQMADNVRTFAEKDNLDEDGFRLLKKAAQALRKDVSLPCTACRYCVPNCPMNLNIPVLLQSYNEMKTGGAWRLVNLFGLSEEERPSACIQCGNCTAHCPQALPVPDAMSEMAETMRKLEK